tara:strand:- start:1557 stop:1718 length:162 start_codon:yes stop_codon:yes gene_type:complete
MSKKVKMVHGQFDHYKKWITDEGYTFLAETQEDAELYVQLIGCNLGKIEEVVD